MNKKINICQPGFNASCSLCCGSHNYIESPEKINTILKNRSINFIEKYIKVIGDEEILIYENKDHDSHEKLNSDAIQCSFVGLLYNRIKKRKKSDKIESNENIDFDKTIGCLIYRNSIIENNDLKEFFNGTCKKFGCYAKDILSDEEIIFAAKLMQDWFYYSLFINEIKLLQNLMKKYSDTEKVSSDELNSIKENLLSQIHEG